MSISLLKPYAKAIAPFVLTVVTVLVNWVFTGALDATELHLAIIGAVTSLVTYLVPNAAKSS